MPLTNQDMVALAHYARAFVEAHERRNPESRWPTLAERAAMNELHANILSLAPFRVVPNRRGAVHSPSA